VPRGGEKTTSSNLPERCREATSREPDPEDYLHDEPISEPDPEFEAFIREQMDEAKRRQPPKPDQRNRAGEGESPEATG
jgi:hypothetical protein